MPLLLLAGALLLAVEAAVPAKPHPNPYQLAGEALDAYRARDLAAWNALLVRPLPAGTKPEDAFPHAALLGPGDRVLGLYFLDEGRRIAAVVQKRPQAPQALWFAIARTADGFAVERLEKTAENPPMDVEVEG